MDDLEQLNTMWLNGFRRAPSGPADARNGPGRRRGATGPTFWGDIFAHDDGSGELISTVWHLLWRGALDIDMTAPWTPTTAVALHIRHTGD